VLLAGGPAAGGYRGRQRRGESGRVREPGDGGAQPLAVGRVAPVHQQAQPHQVAGQPRGDDNRAQVVTGLGAPAGKVLFLPDPLPLAGQQVQPHVVRIPGHAAAGTVKLTRPVVKDLAGGEFRQPLCRDRQPVRYGDGVPRVESQLRRQPVAQAGDLHSVPGGAARFPGDGERDRIAAKGRGQSAREHGGDRCGITGGVAVAEEDLQPRTPVMIGGALAVEAEHLRPRADQRCRVWQPREPLREQRADGRRVELAGKPQAGNEIGSHAIDTAGE
jgi:hypothetical protein